MERKPLSISGISDLSRSRSQMPRTADLIYRELHRDIVSMKLRPRVRTHNQNMTVAARIMAFMKTLGHRS